MAPYPAAQPAPEPGGPPAGPSPAGAAPRLSDPPGAATYADAGVDIAAGDAAVARMRSAVASTDRPGVLGSIGGFGGLFALDPAAYRQPVLVSSTDGVGTKLLVARRAGRYETVGLDLVAMVIDDLVCTGAEPLFLLDYVAVGRLDPEQVATVVAGVAAGCREVGCALIGGETAEHPGAMASDDLDLAGFAVGVVERDRLLGPERVRAGDAVVGLASPGLRSNGYSLARHVLLERAGLDLNGPAWAGASCTLADELLRPSVLYTPAVRAVLVRDADGVHAAAHITGGGLVGNVPRVLPQGLGVRLRRDAWEVPRLFTEIARLGEVGEAEMARVFNLGVGMVLLVPEDHLAVVLEALAATGRPGAVIGEVRADVEGVELC